MLGAAVGIYLGWQRVRAADKQAEALSRQASLARRQHVAELFNRAVGQLKDEKLEVRLGAILTLGQVCLSRLSRPRGPGAAIVDYISKGEPFRLRR